MAGYCTKIFNGLLIPPSEIILLRQSDLLPLNECSMMLGTSALGTKVDPEE